MKIKVFIGCIVIVLIIVSGFFIVTTTKKRPDMTVIPNQLGLLHLADILMNGGTNRWDYQSINYDNDRLYISHLGSNLVTVFDLKNQKVIKDISITASPYGLLVIPQLHAVYVGVGGNNQVAVIDENTMQVTKYIPVGDTPDGLAYDPATKNVFVSNENGGKVSVIDTRKNERIADIPIGGSVGNTHFDSFSQRIYSVSGDDNTLVEIDPITNKVLKKYTLTGCSQPHGFYIEEKTHYFLITCQENNKMVVFDINSKKIITSDTVGTGPDVLAYDPGLHHLYVAAESGELAIFDVRKNKITKLGQAFIATHAHTVSVDRSTHKVYFPLENINGNPILRIYKPNI